MLMCATLVARMSAYNPILCVRCGHHKGAGDGEAPISHSATTIRFSGTGPARDGLIFPPHLTFQYLAVPWHVR